MSQKITLSHVREIGGRIQRPLIIWDNYPVNDLSMSDELHIGPLRGRDPRLPEAVYGYLNNPLLQEEVGLIPLATCFDYAVHPDRYQPEASWTRSVRERFGDPAIAVWRPIRNFCERHQRAKKTKRPLRLSPDERVDLKAAARYLRAHQKEKWAREIKPWRDLIEKSLA